MVKPEKFVWKSRVCGTQFEGVCVEKCRVCGSEYGETQWLNLKGFVDKPEESLCGKVE
jgi:hypothetical protein